MRILETNRDVAPPGLEQTQRDARECEGVCPVRSARQVRGLCTHDPVIVLAEGREEGPLITEQAWNVRQLFRRAGDQLELAGFAQHETRLDGDVPGPVAQDRSVQGRQAYKQFPKLLRAPAKFMCSSVLRTTSLQHDRDQWIPIWLLD